MVGFKSRKQKNLKNKGKIKLDILKINIVTIH